MSTRGVEANEKGSPTDRPTDWLTADGCSVGGFRGKVPDASHPPPPSPLVGLPRDMIWSRGEDWRSAADARLLQVVTGFHKFLHSYKKNKGH